jgi:mRNA-degrading endonuclease toxin of MazEF toxin-antitoxin module
LPPDGVGARAVDATHLGDRVGHLSLDELGSVDDALGLVLDLR